MRRWQMAAVWVGCAVMGQAAASGKDHFLTIGGGYSPTGNQVSLEQNTQFFQHLLEERFPSGAPHDVFFSDGDAPARDVQFWDPNYQIPKVNLLVARVCKEEDELGFQYRSHQVQGLRGPSTRAGIERWFQEVGSKIPPGDRLILYLTGHGGKGNDIQNTHFYCWNNEQVSVRELTQWLDKLPPEVSVVLVMVQCYSGGFAHVLFQEGQVSKGLATGNRCGFFATVHDRPAAGCTPDIYEQEYREYSSPFWAAIHGRTRGGQSVPAPDYDASGSVSFDEAHAYSLLTNDTIDISIKTSDVFLRTYSKTQLAGAPDLLTADTDVAALLATAAPAERAVIEGLSAQLGLTGGERAKEARNLARDIEVQRRDLQKKVEKSRGRLNHLRNALRGALQAAWPEFHNRWDPATCSLLRDRPADVAASIESHQDYSEFDRLYGEADQIENERLALERKWCKCQRLVRTLENVALAANLTTVAGTDQTARYQQLVTLEQGVLGREVPPPAAP